MKWPAVVVAAVCMAVVAAAAPQVWPRPEPDRSRPFGVLAVYSAQPIHQMPLSAFRGHLWIHVHKRIQEGAVCDGKPAGTSVATFVIKDERLHLYNSGDLVQKFWVNDNFGKGSRQLVYFNGNPVLPAGYEDRGWAIDDEDRLAFRGKGLNACYLENNTVIWEVRVSNDDYMRTKKRKKKKQKQLRCLAFKARTSPFSHPVPCTYSLKTKSTGAQGF